MKLQAKKHGGNITISIPPELLTELKWQSGDVLEAAIEGSALRLLRVQTFHDHAMEIARTGMDKYREAFKILAKS